jgi:hypothetical protein
MRTIAWIILLAALQEGSPPALSSVTSHKDPTKVLLEFARPVEQATADQPGNYEIDGGIRVESAVRSALDPRLVVLTVSPLSEGVVYSLKVRNVRDCSAPPVAVAANLEKTFGFTRGIFGGPSAEDHAGARRPPMPKIRQPVLFNTPEADALLSALQVYPRNNPWNEDVSKAKVHPDSGRIVASIGGEKHIDVNHDMGYILVPHDQPRVEVKIRAYPSESDKGPFPVPDGTPIEEWPANGLTLEAGQTTGGEDRHAIVVDPAGGTLYEFYQMFKRSGWECSSEASFDLKTNRLRPRGWTSSDAAGLPIFPSLPRFDEVERGAVEHALRFTVQRSRKEFIYPARHQAGNSDSPAAPAMGQRFRLKASVDLSGLPKHALAVATALKKYGMIVADNGGDWRISTPPDRRITGLEALRKFKGSDFEVIVTTGENDLQRSNP